MSLVFSPGDIWEYTGTTPITDPDARGGAGQVIPAGATCIWDGYEWDIISTPDDGVVYNIIVGSTNGTIFRVGESSSTTLTARVFRNGVEITDDVPASAFKWRRVSTIARIPPFDDDTWNQSHSAGYKQITVDIDEVSSRASFFCDVAL